MHKQNQIYQHTEKVGESKQKQLLKLHKKLEEKHIFGLKDNQLLLYIRKITEYIQRYDVGYVIDTTPSSVKN